MYKDDHPYASIVRAVCRVILRVTLNNASDYQTNGLYQPVG